MRNAYITNNINTLRIKLKHALSAYHAKVELAMRKMKNLYDFGDFVAAVERHGAKAICMEPNDFVTWRNEMSTAKFTKKQVLSDVQEVQFRKGSTKIFWKTDMDNADYEEGEFLEKKTAMKISHGAYSSHETLQAPRGISREKKQDLISKLCPIMPENRRAFWNSLAA